MIIRITVYLLLILLAGCAVTTQRFSPEYSREYLLASDTKAWTDCHIFTNWYSLNIGGLEKVNCFVSEKYNSPPYLVSAEKLESDKKRMLILKKGSLVHIKRIFTIVHEGASYAELLITDPESGRTKHVYAEYWPIEYPKLIPK